jgi:hypothetical protein
MLGRAGFSGTGKEGRRRTGGRPVLPESERNYCVQRKEELMLVIVEGSE